MSIVFYTTHSPSPPARAVETIIRIIKLDVERRYINLITKENLEPWFAKVNPARQVPVLDDNGYVLTDSHAIIEYLLTVHAPKDILEQYYPTDPKERGIITSRWHFESGVLFMQAKTTFVPLVMWGEKKVPMEKTRWLINHVELLDKFLEGKEWLAGDRLTVVDISTITTIDLVELLVPLKHYKNVSAWVERVRKTSPFYDEVGVKDVAEFTALFKSNFTYDAENRWNVMKSKK